MKAFCASDVVLETTFPYSPYQNWKQAVSWGQVEGRLLAMLEGCRELDLSQLTKATLAWAEMEYQKKRHCELATSPLQRWLDGPSVARDCPSMDGLLSAFRRERVRRQRHSDGHDLGRTSALQASFPVFAICRRCPFALPSGTSLSSRE